MVNTDAPPPFDQPGYDMTPEFAPDQFAPDAVSHDHFVSHDHLEPEQSESNLHAPSENGAFGFFVGIESDCRRCGETFPSRNSLHNNLRKTCLAKPIKPYPSKSSTRQNTCLGCTFYLVVTGHWFRLRLSCLELCTCTGPSNTNIRGFQCLP